MIGTEMLIGQGLGNQLFCYVTARCVAKGKGARFGVSHPEIFGNNMHATGGLYFMDVDTGAEISEEEKETMTRFEEREARMFIGNSPHDLTRGCYVAGVDERVFEIGDNTLLYGNLQDERYFEAHKDDVRQWLRLKPEYDARREYTADDLCVIHLRYGDYASHPELLLPRRYWLNGMANMRRINPAMRFVIVTESVDYARKILPDIPAMTNDIGTDYAILKNARYLLLGNSSFAVFPAYTSDELRLAIAPKYWARHNVSDGYWASEQNIYSCFQYQDRKGRLFTPEMCRQELARYKEASARYRTLGARPAGARLQLERLRSKQIHAAWMARRAAASLKRRLTGTQ